MRSDHGSGFEPRIQFARDQLDECGFPGPVRPQDGDVLALRDRQGYAVEHHVLAALHGDILEIDQGDGRCQAPSVNRRCPRTLS